MIPFIDSTIGLLCAFSLLVAFLLVQTNKLNPKGKTYNTINCVASVGLMLYAINTNSVPFIVLNAFWALAALYFLMRRK